MTDKNRRLFLKKLAFSPLLWCFRSRLLRAQTNARKPNLYVIYTPHGPQLSHFLKLSEPDSSLAPLKSLQKKVNVFYGINNPARIRDVHANGMVAVLTGDPELKSGAFSIDQVIGDRFLDDGHTPVGTIVAGVQSEVGFLHKYSDEEHRFSASRRGQRTIMPENNPLSIYNNFIAPTIGKNNSDSNSKFSKVKMDILKEVNISYTEMKNLAKQSSIKDVRVVEKMAADTNDLIKQLSAIEDFKPVGNTPAPVKPGKLALKDPNLGAEIAKAQWKNLNYCLSANISKAVTLNLFASGSTSPYPWVNNAKGQHHRLSHRSNGGGGTFKESERGRALSKDEQTYLNFKTWEAELVADIAQDLDKRKLTDGSTLLDNTIIFWVNCQGNSGNHSHEHWSFVTLGGSNYMKTGNFIEFPWNKPQASDYVTHQELLTSLYRLFDLGDDVTFGSKEHISENRINKFSSLIRL